MQKYIQVITTTDSETKAEEIAKELLGKKASSCVQIFPVKSHYRWKGKIEKSNEFILFIKGKNFESIQKIIKSIHNYENPEIIELPITKGSSEYLKWINEECE